MIEMTETMKLCFTQIKYLAYNLGGKKEEIPEQCRHCPRDGCTKYKEVTATLNPWEKHTLASLLKTS